MEENLLFKPEQISVEIRIGGHVAGNHYFVDEETLHTPKYLRVYLEKLITQTFKEIEERGLI